jgi:hypothetical protein
METRKIIDEEIQHLERERLNLEQSDSLLWYIRLQEVNKHIDHLLELWKIKDDRKI